MDQTKSMKPDLKRTLAILQDHTDELRSRFGAKSFAVFGSLAREEGMETSDVDILVAFERPVDLFDFLELKECLEDLLGRPVDLVTYQALRPQLKARILQEAVYATQGVETPH